ncbi:ABC transporter ATP-binding protein [Corynebacterium diphtheriae]|nr:ABC transporter ATP-binding protein [Corynebacterium diphtheriae]CAB0817660.1 ABC transporter ATP-binding protein [Corynebacterium diphtheriae]CAB0864091.1 ABC transporter ATP-binding protein [Corynebacterium diphtheriae]CAB0864993.1 ABC transporter ATP-binding protein [Corynebacterium diphtheriae]
MPITKFIWSPSGTGLSEHAWATSESTGAAWVGNDASAHISLLRSTVAEELAVPLEQAGMDAATMQRAVDTAIDTWGLRGQAEQDPMTLSSGQTRRLAIAGALITRPEALVLDCPTDGLDAEAIEILHRIVDSFPGNVTVYDRMRTALATTAAEQLRLTSSGDLVPEPAPDPVDTVSARFTPIDLSTDHGPLLCAKNLRIPRGATTVGPISCEVSPGSVTHLAGLNGTGKTSFFLAALGLAASTGTLQVADGVTMGWAPADMDSALSRRTVATELTVGATPELAQAAIEFMGLEQWADTHPLDVPAAWRRFVLIAAALVRGPHLLLLDEPTVNVDAPNHGHLSLLMHRYCAGEFHRMAGLDLGGHHPAVLFTCHDARYAQAVSTAEIRI